MGAALKGHVHPVPSKALQAQEHPVDGLVRVVLHPHALAFLLAQLWSGLAVAALRPTGRCLLVHDLRLSRRGGFTPGGRGRIVARRACRRPLAPLPRQDILQPEAPKAANHGGRVAAAGRRAAVGRLAPQLLQREAVAPRAGLLRCPADPLALGLSLIARRRRFLLLSLLLLFPIVTISSVSRFLLLLDRALLPILSLMPVAPAVLATPIAARDGGAPQRDAVAAVGGHGPAVAVPGGGVLKAVRVCPEAA
mmetsp:Transcript_37538/g.94877  ORF Transcript_37538/g.94877 Transcript_37538/m.94877 type:complete len:251 (+) Transcript_37538:311-1063(+)